MKPDWPKSAHYLYLAGLGILIASLPLSKFTMSVSQMMLGMAWLLMGDYKARISRFFGNRVALALSSLFLIHVLGLFYTTDFTYAVKDLRVKFPLLIVPFMFATFPRLSERKISYLVYLFAASTTVATLISFYRFSTDSVDDYRELSPFISHIRFSLLVCLSAFLMYYQAWHEKRSWIRRPALIAALWLTLMLFILQSATSLIIFFATTFVVVGYLGLIRVSRLFRIILLLVMMVPTIWAFVYTYQTFQDFITIKKVDLHHLDQYTLSGNKYRHDTTAYWIENGRHGGLYQCESELEEEWNKRSQIKFDSLDANGQLIQYTLIRYLTSLNLRKDSSGVAALNASDIRHIENGLANHDYLIDSKLKTAINKIALGYYQYRWKKDTRGSSLMQRIELWKTSLQLINQNPWLGVGTGDIPSAFRKQLHHNQSELAGSGLRSHNQFLSITVALGILGLIWFTTVLIFVIVSNRKWLDFRALVSYCIIVFSMFNEDTIETQAGVTFFVFFLSLFLILQEEPATKPSPGNNQKTEPKSNNVVETTIRKTET